MSAGKTAIANLALSRLGEPAIMDMTDENSEVARLITVVYEPTVREIARDHEWNCLRKRANIPQLATAPEFGYDHAYQLPPDFIRLLRLNGRDVQERTALYDIEGRHLLTDADAAKIQYIGYVEDTTIYDDLFIECLAVRLASKLATIIRDDEAKGQQLSQEYLQVALPRARKVDGNERNKAPYDPREQSRSLNARRLGTWAGSVDVD
jgi:hypothetical protein